MSKQNYISEINGLNMKTIEDSYKIFEATIKEDSYLNSYGYFIKHFEIGIESCDDLAIITGAFMIYGWMPTILKNFDFNQLSKASEILRKAKSSDQLDKNELEILSKCINNSFVGTSKLLHFVNPLSFPILDSVIFRAICSKMPQKISAPMYLAYQKKMKELSTTREAEDLRQDVNSKLSSILGIHHQNQVTTIRALEMILFYKGKFNKENKNDK